MGGEFAEEFPKIARRLGLRAFACDDPYVERLLEGFAFLAARVRLKVDAEFPRFTRHLLEMVYPHFLSPLPSMTVVQIEPDYDESDLSGGIVVPRGELLRGIIGKNEQTPCEYRTAHNVTLWPVRLSEAEYLSSAGAVSEFGISPPPGLKAGLRIRLETTAGLAFNDLSLDRLPMFLRGGAVAYQLYEQLTANLLGAVIRPARRQAPWAVRIPVSNVTAVGFEDDEALLPYTPRSFQGYRLLQEYFAMPQRFLFIETRGLEKAVERCQDTDLDIIYLLKQNNPNLSRAVDASHFELYCTPAINLFPKRADRIHLTQRSTEHHIIPNGSRPTDFEVYSVSKVEGFDADAERMVEFMPFYGIKDEQIRRKQSAYYTLQRVPRRIPTHQRQTRARSSYVGSEVFISLVDADESPYSGELKQIGLHLLCTNRDLPLHMPYNISETDFSLLSGVPVRWIRCAINPTVPRSSTALKSGAWPLISHLSLNYLSLIDNDVEQGSAALRQILALYGDMGEPEVRNQIDGVRSVRTEPIVRRIPVPGPITFGRGLQVSVEFDDAAFQGAGVALLGAVLERFFAQYTGINSFTETVIRTMDRGEIMRWPARIGQRRTL